MIVRNEELNLPACLESLRGVADELIVTDTGSTDRTPDIAKLAGAQVLSFPWNENEADARNAGLQCAQGRWILWVDADEVVSQSLAQTLRHDLPTLDNSPSVGAATVILRNWFAPQVHRCGRALRLARNHPQLRFTGEVHPRINVAGTVVALDGCLEHYGYIWTPEQRRTKGDTMRRRLEPLCSGINAPLDRLSQWLTACVIADDPPAVLEVWRRIAALHPVERLSGTHSPDWRLHAPNALEFWAARNDFQTGRALARELALAVPPNLGAWRYAMKAALRESHWQEVSTLGEIWAHPAHAPFVEGELVDETAARLCAQSCLALAAAHTGSMQQATALFPTPCPVRWLHHFVALTDMGLSRPDDPTPLRVIARLATRPQPTHALTEVTTRIGSLLAAQAITPAIELLAALTLAKMEASAGKTASALARLNHLLTQHPDHPWVRGAASLAAEGIPLAEALDWRRVLAEL
jgi:hypothetical protein